MKEDAHQRDHQIADYLPRFPVNTDGAAGNATSVGGFAGDAVSSPRGNACNKARRSKK